MSIPKEPRQLMINLMYLVLTAMLALNVSAKIINAFFVIDRGIKNSNEIFDKSNEFAMSSLAKSVEQDAERYQPLLKAAQEAKGISSEFNGYVESLRAAMVDETGGYYTAEEDEEHAGQPKGMKNKDVTTRYLVNEGKGAELEQRINETREKLVSLMRSLIGTPGTAITAETVAELERSISLKVDEAWKKDKSALKKNKNIDWASYTFNQMPLASVFPLLTKIQNDMKSSEAAILNYLVGQVGATTFKVDQFIPISSAKKSYIIAGENYESEISVGASSKSITDNVVISVDGRPLKVENGIAKFTAGSSTTGVRSYKVDVTLTNPTTKKRETYSKVFEYEVGRRNVTVSADKMNVFYIGVDNPISVVAAGVSTNTLRVTGSGGGISLVPDGAGKYTVKAGSVTNEATIGVSGEGLPLSSFKFRVKRIPDPVAKLGTSTGGDIGNGEFKAQAGLVPILENFDFDARCTIQGFNLIYSAPRQDPVEISNPGAVFNAESRAAINKAKPGDRYFFDNVRAKCPGDDVGRKINSLAFKIR
ncbi:MAG: gliding motility protein GldM [Saprospiraceae bacterium]